MSQSSSQTSNKTLGRFQVKKRLGEGMQGKVYLGWDLELERHVALKLLKPIDGALHDSEEIINEARVTAKFSHPNIVQLYEVTSYNGMPLLVFEYVDGITLTDHLKEKGRCNEKETLSIINSITSALKIAHEQGIMHLDLSSHNIMIDKEGRCRIMDFGLARVIANVDNSLKRNKAAGTPRFMTPEHVSGGRLSPASDIYSLGLIYYELLTGKSAISLTSDGDIIKAVKDANIDWGSLQHLCIRPEIIATIRDMLHVDPTYRFQSAAELLPALIDISSIQREEEKGQLSIDFILRRLQRRPEFPACSTNISKINELTDESSNTDFNKLGAVIIRDYSLTNRILKVANSVIFDRGTGGVTTVQQAVSRLGLKLVRMICNGLLLFKQVENKSSDLQDIIVTSFIAGLIARHTALSIKRSLAEEAFICALFHNLGNHLLVFYLPDEYIDIVTLIEEGEEPRTAERAILSTTSSTLGMAVAKKWNFPERIINCMAKLPPETIEAPKNIEETLRHLANYANELCELVKTKKLGNELIIEMNLFFDRHQAIFPGDITTLSQLTAAAAEKFSALAPELGVNYNDSVFCKHLESFAFKIEATLEEEQKDDFLEQKSASIY
jgi:serine/threonine protein kinase